MNELKAKKIFEKAQKNFEKFKYDEARDLWLKILEFYPENLSLLRNISLTYFNQKKFFETEKILKKQVTAILRLKGLVVRDVPGSAFFQHVLFVTGNCPGVTKWKKEQS